MWWRKDDIGNEGYVVTGHLGDGATSIGLEDMAAQSGGLA